MNRLMLLRHAKAGWAEPGMRDFDRPLEKSGHRQAFEIGETMLAKGLVPDIVLCSSAKRARETWDGVEEALSGKAVAVSFQEKLYTLDAAGYLEEIREIAEDGSLLVIGHNPTMEDVSHAFAAHGDKVARQRLASGFPPAALAVFRLEGPFAAATPATSSIETFLMPDAR